MGKPRGFLRLMRPINCAMMGFAVIVGAAIASPDVFASSWLTIIYGFVTGFTLTAASMSINDCFDKNIDAINEPDRPIPSGLVNSSEALVFALILTTIGFTFAYLTSIPCLGIAILAWAIFVAYTTVGKQSGLPGNFLVSIVVSVPLIYGSYAVTGTFGLNVLIFVSMVFLSNTGREITKGIVDVKGDKRQNVKTLAVLFGGKGAAVSAVIFYMLAVLLSPAPWILSIVSIWFIPLVAITDLGLIASSFSLLKDHSRANARRVKKAVLLWLLIGLLAFVMGAVR